MHPKIRSPLVSWLLTVMTGGIYLFFWVWLVATELNNAEQKNVFPVKLWRNATVTLYILALVGFLLALNAVTSLLAVAAILGLVGLFLSVQVSIGNYIKCKDGELNTGKKYSNLKPLKAKNRTKIAVVIFNAVSPRPAHARFGIHDW